MDDLYKYVETIFKDDIYKCVFSDNRNKESKFKKAVAEIKNDKFQVERFTEKQAFHENIGIDEIKDTIYAMAQEGFKQMNFRSSSFEYSLKITKKDKVLYNRKKAANECENKESHNRVKKYIIPEGEIVPPLVDMGVFTKDGKVVNSMYDKYRQINKFIEFIDDAVNKSGLESINIIDFGCGKSYLTFVVYYYFEKIKNMKANIIGLDLKADVIEKCNKAAEKYGYDRLKFQVGDINGYKSPFDVDMVISLHACDTATDFALFNAVSWNSKIIISVPCCQHELCGQMDSEEIAILQRYGIVKERVAALMTDSIRANLLECCGYKTQLLEFIDFEHTPKNILIRAVKRNIGQKHKEKMLDEVNKLCKCFNLEPTLYKLLNENGYIKTL